MANSSRLREPHIAAGEDLRREAARSGHALRGYLNEQLTWWFAFTRSGALRRLFLFLVITFLLWLGLAFLTASAGRGSPLTLDQWMSALFDRSILRHFIVLGLGSFIALVIAGTFLDDIFELDDILVAESFLIQATFLPVYERVTIRDGSVAEEDRASPVFLIGGPGLLDVHLENVALFEKIDGAPHIVQPTEAAPAVLDGFERLRRVVDLRDQVVELTLDGRTKDGIPISAQDVRMVFSVLRGQPNQMRNEDFSQPYTFSLEAIEDLVYGSGTQAWTAVVKGMISSELRSFISQHTLSEFLTYELSPEDGSIPVTRDELTSLFYDFAQGFTRKAHTIGVELHWIGVGTWVTPSEIIPERQQDAFRQSWENRLRSSAATLERIHQEARIAELLRLVDEIPAAYYSMVGQEESDEVILRELALAYREKFRHAYELYRNQNQPVPPELRLVLEHLDMI